MKTLKIILSAMLLSGIAFNASAQELGNANYRQGYRPQQQSMNNITTDNGNVMTFSVRGIYNEKPDMYLATFSLVQVGTSLEEIDALMNGRINAIRAGIKKIDPAIEVFTDMISFVPVYEYEVTKRLFSKKTYTEKPAGYEMKKNLIIKYKSPGALDGIMSLCAAQEVYDLVKVDYVITGLDAIHAKLQAKTLEEFNNKLKYYSLLKGIDLAQKEKLITENYNLVYPAESYASYTAFSRVQLPFAQNSNVNEIPKTETSYYNQVMAKPHTFVVNPEVTEPCVQVFYDLHVVVKLKKEEPAAPAPAPAPTPVEQKTFYIITQNGDVRRLDT